MLKTSSIGLLTGGLILLNLLVPLADANAQVNDECLRKAAAVGISSDCDGKHGLQARGQHRSEQENPRCLQPMIAHDFIPWKLWKVRRR